MRVAVIGDNASAQTLREYLARAGSIEVTNMLPAYRVFIEQVPRDYDEQIVIDGVESELEHKVLRYVSELTKEGLHVQRQGGRIHKENEIRIVVPRDAEKLVAVEKGVLRALLDLSGHGKKTKKSVRNLFGLLTMLVLSAVGLFSQQTPRTSPSTVTVSNFPALQPISSTQLPALLDAGGLFKIHEQGTALTDPQDRAGRLLGHVTFDNASLAVTGTFWQSVQPISGTVTANIAGSISNTSFIATQATGANLHVQVDAAPSTAVTNAGTFAVQASIAAAQTLATVTTVSAVTAITNSLPAGTNLLGKVGIDQTTPGTTNATESLPDTIVGVALTPSAKATLTTAVVVKASAGNVYGVSVTNGAASVCWLEFMNASSSPVLGTAAIFSIALPASATVNFPPGSFPMANFSTGISVGIATLVNGSTACGTAGNVTVFYK